MHVVVLLSCSCPTSKCHPLDLQKVALEPARIMGWAEAVKCQSSIPGLYISGWTQTKWNISNDPFIPSLDPHHHAIPQGPQEQYLVEISGL